MRTGRVGVVRACRTLMAIKWRLLRNGFRGSLQQRLQTGLALVFSMVLGVVGLLVFSALGTAFGAGDQVIVVVLPVLVLGIGLLAAASGVETTIDVRNLACEPMTTTEFGTATLAAAVVGPPAMLAGLSGIGLGLGFGGSGAAALAVTSLVVVGWWATLLLVSRTFANLLGVLAQGRMRHVAQSLAALASLGLWLAAQFSARSLSGWDRDRWAGLADRFAWSPPGQLGRAAGEAAHQPAAALGHLLLGVLWLPLLWLAHNALMARLVTAPPRAGTDRRRVRTGTDGVRAGLLRFLPSGRTGAITARTLRTKARTPREAVNTVVAVLLGVGALVIAPLMSGNVDSRIVLSAGLLHFAVLFEGNNTFGYDGPPIWMEVVAGADGASLARGKALTSVMVIAVPATVLVFSLAAVFDGWRWVPAGLMLALGSLFMASGASIASAAMSPFAVPEGPNPFAAGDTGHGCLAGAILALDMVVLTLVSLPVGIGVWWASGRSATQTTLVALSAPLAGALVLWAGIRVARHLLQGREYELVAKVTPAR